MKFGSKEEIELRTEELYEELQALEEAWIFLDQAEEEDLLAERTRQERSMRSFFADSLSKLHNLKD